MSPGPFALTPGGLSLADIRDFLAQPRAVSLAGGWREPVERSAQAVGAVLAQGRTVYGINTGFGSLARTRIEPGAVEDLQHNLLRSHAAGVGAVLPDAVVRLIMLLKINSLAIGHSGVRPLVIEQLLQLLNAGIVPQVPGQGSVGASGDLAPLAHLSLALTGEGDVAVDGRTSDAATALRAAGLAPIRLAAKEGLALINGTQVSTALALAGLLQAEQCLKSALVSGALSVDAMLGSDAPFAERIQRIRGQPGQIAVARVLARLLAGSEIRQSHLACERVQDPYSLRCQPQVMGACLDVLRQAAATLTREANGVSDNPLVFAEDGDIVSGGNFHAEPVAFAADMIALALAEIGSLAERRIALLTDAHMSGLPPFLVAEPGLNSGFMIPQVTAAALVAENKLLAHPASVDSLPTSANQEDHVSMATHGARRLLDMAANARGVVAIELLAAAQGIDFRRPLRTAPVLGEAVAMIRADVPFLDRDRPPAPDIEAMRRRIAEGRFAALVREELMAPGPEGVSGVEGVRARPL